MTASNVKSAATQASGPTTVVVPVDPAVLALLRCPATKETLREVVKADGTRALVNESGTCEYALVRGIAVLVAKQS
jgi:uncharacterized protein YbaR (Trm112 family)